MNILNKKITVCTVLAQVKKAKVKGNLNLKSLYLYNVIDCYLQDLKCKEGNITDIRKLEDLLIKIKYSSNVSDHKMKDLKSFKNAIYCKGCGDTFGHMDTSGDFTPIVPTVDDMIVDLLMNNYTFKTLDFTSNFNSYSQGAPLMVRITSLPTIGTITYNNQPILQGFEFNIIDVVNLKFNVIGELNDDFSFDFQTSNSNSLKTYSNMATFTFNVDAYTNLPPTTVGDRTVTIPNASTYVITAADLTTATTPVYSDPENDPVANVKITVLPLKGVVKLNGVNVTINQIIAFTDITSGNLTYEADNMDTSAHTEGFEFELSDTGSNTFVG